MPSKSVSAAAAISYIATKRPVSAMIELAFLCGCGHLSTEHATTESRRFTDWRIRLVDGYAGDWREEARTEEAAPSGSESGAGAQTATED